MTTSREWKFIRGEAPAEHRHRRFARVDDVPKIKQFTSWIIQQKHGFVKEAVWYAIFEAICEAICEANY